MKRFLNVIIALSAISLVALVMFIFVESLNILKLFPFIVLTSMFLVAAFSIKLFIYNNELPKLLKWGVVILAILPLSVPLFGLIDASYVETNWPLMVAGLVLYAGLGLLSILGMFTKQNKPPYLSRMFLLIFGLLLALWFIFILLKIVDDQLYNYTFIFGVVTTLIYLFALSVRLIRK